MDDVEEPRSLHLPGGDAAKFLLSSLQNQDVSKELDSANPHHRMSQFARIYKHEKSPATKSSLLMASMNRCGMKRKRETDINWGDLDPDILFSIFNHLPSLIDLHRAKSVCWGWNKAATRNKAFPLPAEMPWLIFTPFEPSKFYYYSSVQVDCDRSGRFLSMEERKFYPFYDRAVEKMDDGCCFCSGSSCGWLVCLDKVAVPFLLNPFTSQIINLPPMDLSLLVKKVVGTGHECFLTESHQEIEIERNHFVKKVALSSSPSNKYFYLVIIYGGWSKLGFYGGGDKSWSMLDSETYSDIIFHQNHLYALSEVADYVGVWDMNNQHHVRKITIQLEEINMMPPSNPNNHEDRFYLVESQGSLLVVQRFIKVFYNEEGDPYFSESESESHGGLDKHLNLIPYRSLDFKVFKLDNEQKISREMKCLPKGIALFLGRNQSFSMEVRNSNAFKQDMIYFTDDSHGWKDEIDHGGHDSGVFALKDKRVDWLYGNEIENQKSPPTWLLPCISS